MSQEQPQRPCEDQQELIKYGVVFSTVLNKLPQQAFQGVSDGKNRSDCEKGPAATPSAYKELCPITIGVALQATVLTAGQKAVDRSDAAAIQAAEVRATGQTNIMPGGLAATAQSAAQFNAKPTTQEKTTLADVLSEAAAKLPKDRPVTRQDAEGVMGAELRNNPNISTYPGGVAASVVAAARINQSNEQLSK
ncbi:late embryogenesis abundant protein 47-like [Chenopodium quinoa]|uniref:late embryogenesis abundant protein 47-like n=1 Tax=Chenopodium quinoa TaxID=63459 RepID=UPI000B76F90B|nr:late embryogenesis abundant protein 47-like [Chenopodium quinoa]